VKKKQAPTLGLATGGTPIGLYENLIREHQQSKLSYRHVTTVNLDEYVGLAAEDPNSYRYYMNQTLFNGLDIDKMRTNLPNGTSIDLDRECERYERLVKELGGVDLQILGIGENGHIGFNEPGTPFSSNTHVLALTETTRKANSRYFSSLNKVPTHAITMGISTILKSKEIILLASGKSKANALYKLFYGNIEEEFPVSALRNHKKLTVIADRDALSLVNETRKVGIKLND